MTNRITSDSTYLRNWARSTSPEMRKHLTLQWLSNLRCPDKENAALEFIDLQPCAGCAGLSNSTPQYQSHLRLVP